LGKVENGLDEKCMKNKERLKASELLAVVGEENGYVLA
jgi:hypothetical protein